MATFTDCADELTCAALTSSNGIAIATSTSGSNKIFVLVSGSITGGLDSIAGVNTIATNILTASNLYVAGTASVALLNYVSQATLKVGDKYIVLMTGSADHTSLSGSGLLWGSGSTGSTIGPFGENAYIKFDSNGDQLEIFPGLRSAYITGTSISSSNYIGITSNSISDFSSAVRSQFSAGTNITINNGVISASDKGTVSTGSAGYIAYYPSTGTTVDDTSTIYTNGTNVGISTTSLTAKLTVNGNADITGTLKATSTISGSAVYGLSGSSAQFPNFTTDVRKQISAGTNIGYDSSTGIISASGFVTSVSASSPIISTGGFTPTMSLGTVPVGNGGTGRTSLTADYVLVGNNASAVALIAHGNSGSFLGWDGSTWTAAVPASGGSGVVNTGSAGYIAYYPSAGTTVDDTSTIYTDGTKVGVGTSSPTNKLTVNGNADITGSLYISAAVTASSISGAFSGSGALINNLTASNISNFTGDVRNQFTAGSNIGISAGVVSLSSSVSTTAVSGTIGLSGALGLFTILSSSTITGSNTKILTSLSASQITASFISGTQITGAFSGSGALINNLTASNIINFTADVRNQFTAGTNITINNGAISASGGGSGTVNSGNAGYMAFYASAGTTIDDTSGSNGGAYWDNTNARLGVNTASPTSKLEVNGDISGTLLRLSTNASAGTAHSNVLYATDIPKSWAKIRLYYSASLRRAQIIDGANISSVSWTSSPYTGLVIRTTLTTTNSGSFNANINYTDSTSYNHYVNTTYPSGLTPYMVSQSSPDLFVVIKDNGGGEIDITNLDEGKNIYLDYQYFQRL